ncbi:MAG: IMP cyclohydrolase [Bacillota bacterium]
MELAEVAGTNLEKLRGNAYPGRGLIIGQSPGARHYVQVYWIMGRSVNSRNRIFVQEGDAVRTKAFDESQAGDPSLIIYYPLKSSGGRHIVTNGDQTETINDYMKAGKTFFDAVKTRIFEPDAPNYTPRISGVLDLEDGKGSYTLSILKTQNGDPGFCQKIFYYYDTFIPGFGHCIHTYDGDGEPLPSFSGDPELVRLFDDLEETAQYYWELLNADNRVSLLVKFVEKEGGKSKIKIINKNG